MSKDPVKAGPFGDGDHVEVVIETPSGSRTKYRWDPEARAFRAGHVLPLGLSFPFDFGFVPRTLADDGDPLDALVLADAPLVVGCLVECRVLGAYELKQSDEHRDKLIRNDRLIVVPCDSLRGKEWHNLKDLGRPLCDAIGSFFEDYVKREHRKIEMLGRVQHRAAVELVKDAKR